MSYDFLSLKTTGHARSPVPNRFLKQVDQSDILTVMLPGLNYSCDNPLLYYTSSLLLQHSADVLQLWVNYTPPQFQALSKPDQLNWMLEDAQALIDAGQKQRNYQQLIIVGKSIGTLTMGALFSQIEGLIKATSIWFTPLIHYPVVVEGALRARGKELFLAGTGDATYDAQAMARIQAQNHCELLVIEGADHSLQFPNDTVRSLDVMKEIINKLEAFIDMTMPA